MSQLILFVALDVLGVAICMAVGPWQRIWLCSALGFAVGLACMVVFSLAALLLDVFDVGVMVTLYVALLGVCITVSRKRWTRDTLLAAACGVLGFATLCLPFCDFNFSAFSYDSHMFVAYGRVVGDDGMTLDMLEKLSAWGVFQVVAHALSMFVAEDYLYALAPAFAVSMLAAFAVLLDEGLQELRVARVYRVVWIALGIAGLLAVPIFRFHVVYIHTNMASAGYLLFFVALFWLAELKNDATYFPIAMLSLLAFTLLRIESTPYAILFLLLTVMGARLPPRAVLPWYLLYTVVLAAWFALLALAVPASSIYLTPTKAVLFGAGLLLMFAYWSIKDRWLFRHLTRYLPHLAVAACVLGIVASYLTNGDNMRTSAERWLGDLWSSPWWASIWKLVAVLAVVGLFVPSPPVRKPLALGILLFFGLTLIVSSSTTFGRDIDGSLIRMTIHILPVVVFYGALKFAPLLSATRER